MDKATKNFENIPKGPKEEVFFNIDNSRNIDRRQIKKVSEFPDDS